MTPLQLKLAGLAAIALVIAGLTIWGLYWRGEYRSVKATIVSLEDQTKVLAGDVKACSAGVDAAKAAGDAAIQKSRLLLAEARRLHAAGNDQVARLEALLERPTPAGAGCSEAWGEIEKARAPR